MVHLEVTHTHAVCSYCGSNWRMRIPSYHFTPEFLACVHAKGAVFIKNVFSIRERVARTNSDSYQILKLRPPVSTQDRVTLQKLVVCYTDHRSFRHELSSQDFTLRHTSLQALSSATSISFPVISSEAIYL
jgi:hypothetical protein